MDIVFYSVFMCTQTNKNYRKHIDMCVDVLVINPDTNRLD